MLDAGEAMKSETPSMTSQSFGFYGLVNATRPITLLDLSTPSNEGVAKASFKSVCLLSQGLLGGRHAEKARQGCLFIYTAIIETTGLAGTEIFIVESQQASASHIQLYLAPLIARKPVHIGRQLISPKMGGALVDRAG